MEKYPFKTSIPLFNELRGPRVLVRPYREEDAQQLFEAIAESRDHLRPWLPFADAHQTIAETRDWILHKVADWALREELAASIWSGEDGHFFGGIGARVYSWEDGSFEIGYWLRASAAGYGYMTEAARLLSDYLFEHHDAQRVVIRCDEQNTHSAAVARKLGYILEGRLRNYSRGQDRPRNVLVFSMIPSDR